MTGTVIQRERQLRAFVARHQVTLYFAATFAISWVGALSVAGPALLRGNALPKTVGLMMFPIMLLGPCLTGVTLTRMIGGRSGLNELFSQMWRIRVGLWYAGLLIPPSLILIVLLCLKSFVSPITPHQHLTIPSTRCFLTIAKQLTELDLIGEDRASNSFQL